MSATAVPLRPVKKGLVLKLWLTLALLALAAGALAWWGTRDFQYVTTESGLRYKVIEQGSGAKPTANDVVLIDYTGRLENGTVFDSTKGKQPVPLPVGGSIPGFTEGLQLMSKGATYRFRIPPELAYGAQGAGGVIPPDATLDFEVTLREFIPLSQFQNMMGAAGPQGQQAPAN